jgi:hypothetical protein
MSEVYWTRREGVNRANEAGIPLSLSRVNKDAHFGRGPVPAGRYGPAHVYKPEVFMEYAHSTIKRVPEKSTA